MLLRGMLSDEEAEILDLSKVERFGAEDAKRIHRGFELGQLAKEEFAADHDAVVSIVRELNLNSTEGRSERSLRISQEVNAILTDLSAKCQISKIAAVRAILHLRHRQLLAKGNSTVHLMTWNTGLYRKAADAPEYAGIVKVVRDFLKKEDSLAILQEIPYKSQKDGKFHPLFKQMEKDFPSEEYSFHYRVSNDNQIMMTVMLCKKKNTRFTFPDPLYVESNRIVTCRAGDGELIIMGVHMPTDFEQKETDTQEKREVKQFRKDVWSSLVACAKEFSETQRKFLIAGDFNAYIGCREAATEEQFIDLSRQAKDIIPDDSPTFIGKTAIDHVLINFDAKSQYSFTLEEGFSHSDHRRIEVTLTQN